MNRLEYNNLLYGAFDEHDYTLKHSVDNGKKLIRLNGFKDNIVNADSSQISKISDALNQLLSGSDADIIVDPKKSSIGYLRDDVEYLSKLCDIMSGNKELAHHGIKGQKWGVRRFQNEDGSLTEEGKHRYYKSNGELSAKKIQKDLNKLTKLKNEIDYNRDWNSKDEAKGHVITDEQREEIAYLDKEYERTKQRIDGLVKLAKDNGYSVVESERTLKKSHVTKVAVAMSFLVGGVLGAALIVGTNQGINYARTGDIMYKDQTKYKVRKPNTGLDNAYDKYMKEHPGSDMSKTEFKNNIYK